MERGVAESGHQQRLYRDRWPRQSGEDLGGEGAATSIAPAAARPLVGRRVGGHQSGRQHDCQQFARLGTVLLGLELGASAQAIGAGSGRPVDGGVLAVRQVCDIRIARGQNIDVRRGVGQGGAGAGSAERQVHVEHCLCESS